MVRYPHEALCVESKLGCTGYTANGRPIRDVLTQSGKEVQQLNISVLRHREERAAVNGEEDKNTKIEKATSNAGSISYNRFVCCYSSQYSIRNSIRG